MTLPHIALYSLSGLFLCAGLIVSSIWLDGVRFKSRWRKKQGEIAARKRKQEYELSFGRWLSGKETIDSPSKWRYSKDSPHP
jgi:hypothetical protein